MNTKYTYSTFLSSCGKCKTFKTATHSFVKKTSDFLRIYFVEINLQTYNKVAYFNTAFKESGKFLTVYTIKNKSAIVLLENDLGKPHETLAHVLAIRRANRNLQKVAARSKVGFFELFYRF